MTTFAPPSQPPFAARLARRAVRQPARLLRRHILPKLLPPAAIRAPSRLGRARVVGLLSSASGLGKSARLCAETLMQWGYEVSTHDVAWIFASDDRVPCPAACEEFSPGGFSIFHLNPPMLLPGMIGSGLARYYRSFNIGYWAWELETLPREWVTAIPFMQAIIVPSRFCQAAVQRYTSKPVLVVPHPVAAPPREAAQAAPAGGRPFRVLTIFRFGSSFERKNPIALVRAFARAFGDDSGAELILKTSDGARFPHDAARLAAAIQGMRNITLIDEVWDEGRMAALMRSAHVYASLHRSEGFGLPLAEAMMAGVPVVATDWSGNTDFCSPDHTFPVDYDLISFRDRHPDYEQVGDARWANPSVEHAAAQLRLVRGDPAAAQAKAREARLALLRHLGGFGYERALSSLAEAAGLRHADRPQGLPAPRAAPVSPRLET